MTVFDGTKEKGQYEEKIDVTKFSSGIYFYRLVSNNYSIAKKMIFIK
jgi:hypothetical protein